MITDNDDTNLTGGRMRQITQEEINEALGKKDEQPVQRQSPIMKHFQFGHLPAPLQSTSSWFYDVACKIEANIPDSAEKSAGLRKLLEAKDCIVRAALGS